jgi:hypothetical protein
MPRKPTAFNEQAIGTLRHLIKVKSNLNCQTFSQIQMLHEDILNTTNVYLSVQTLNRVLGIIKSDFRPSLHTLNTLARYLNYASFDELQALHSEEAQQKEEKTNFISSFFHSVFSDVDGGENPNDDVVKNIIRWMNNHDQFSSDFYRSVASTEYGREIFYNRFVNVDQLNLGFGNGLQYYLLHASNKQDKCFAYILNCYRYFLSGRNEMFKRYFALIKNCAHSEIIHFRPEIIDRFYAILILNKGISPSDEENDDELALDDFDMLSSSSFALSNSNFFVGEAHLLRGEFSKAWNIFNNCNIKDLHVPELLRNDFALLIRIYKLLSGLLSNNLSSRRALSQYLEIYKMPLPFLHENFASFFVLLIKYKLTQKRKIRKNILETYETMVQKTEFKYMNTFLEIVINVNEAGSKTTEQLRSPA